MNTMAYTNQQQQQIPQQAWSTDTADVHQLTCDENYWYTGMAYQHQNMMTNMTNQQSYPGVPNYWYAGMAAKQRNMMYNSGSYLNNDGYNFYEAFRP